MGCKSFGISHSRKYPSYIVLSVKATDAETGSRWRNKESIGKCISVSAGLQVTFYDSGA
jgi:hypothetical protein